MIQDGIDTCGRHPWHLQPPPNPSQGGGKNTTNPLGRLAIGESGLDKVCATPYSLQLDIFREEVQLSEELQKPLFLHCVRAIDDVLRIRREIRAQQPWIWHGYRGNAQQLQQLLPHGFYFSFGIHFNEQALLSCPLDRLLMETDDDTQHPIADLYAHVAHLRNLSLDNLIAQMHQNFRTLFGREA